MGPDRSHHGSWPKGPLCFGCRPLEGGRAGQFLWVPAEKVWTGLGCAEEAPDMQEGLRNVLGNQGG